MNQNDLINMLMSRCNGNPMAMNVVKMMQNGDNKGLELMAINMCKEKGTTPEKVIKQVKEQFHMN